jgi:putative alpha-1,2-mannosidase
LDTHGQGFIEGNSWNYSLYVPHQPTEMMALMGGKKTFRVLFGFTVYHGITG